MTSERRSTEAQQSPAQPFRKEPRDPRVRPGERARASLLALVCAGVLALAGCERPPLDWDALEATITPGLRISYRPHPKYPVSALRRQIRGQVLIEASLARSGRVIDPRVVASDPEGLFDRVALKAVRQWRYRPRRDGEPDYPNPVRILVPFDLEGQRPVR